MLEKKKKKNMYINLKKCFKSSNKKYSTFYIHCAIGEIRQYLIYFPKYKEIKVIHNY